MDHILIDADVILDVIINRSPWSGPSADILSLCENDKVKGYITPVILSNVYYVLRRHNSHLKVLGSVMQLLQFINVLSMDAKIVRSAINSKFKDLEDAMQNFTAISHKKISVIITRNTKDYKYSELAVMTPETYLKSLRV